MKLYSAVKILLLTTSLVTMVHAQSKFKNLQVLDKNISKDELKTKMNSFADYLDVKCSFCHILDEYHKDDKEHKLIARKMIRLTRMIRSNNTKYFPKDFKPEEFTCFTCHNGQAEIKPYNPDEN